MRKFPKAIKNQRGRKGARLGWRCIAVKVPGKACAAPAPSDQAEALVLLHGLGEAAADGLFGLVAGHVQQVVAGVGHRQVVLRRRGGLDDDAQALHAVDRDPVAAGEENCRRNNERNRIERNSLFSL